MLGWYINFWGETRIMQQLTNPNSEIQAKICNINISRNLETFSHVYITNFYLNFWICVSELLHKLVSSSLQCLYIIISRIRGCLSWQPSTKLDLIWIHVSNLFTSKLAINTFDNKSSVSFSFFLRIKESR